MYADDEVIFTQAKNLQDASSASQLQRCCDFFMTVSTAGMYLHRILFLKLGMCRSNGTQTYRTALQKIFDKKPYSFHLCIILEKHNFLSFVVKSIKS